MWLAVASSAFLKDHVAAAALVTWTQFFSLLLSCALLATSFANALSLTTKGCGAPRSPPASCLASCLEPKAHVLASEYDRMVVMQVWTLDHCLHLEA